MLEYFACLIMSGFETLGAVMHKVENHEVLRVDKEKEIVTVGRDIYRGLLSPGSGWEERQYHKTKGGIQETIIPTDGVSYEPRFVRRNILTEKEVKKINPGILKALNNFPDYIEEAHSTMPVEEAVKA